MLKKTSGRTLLNEQTLPFYKNNNLKTKHAGLFFKWFKNKVKQVHKIRVKTDKK